MALADETIATLAPGQWRLSGMRNGTDLVRVSFAGARDIAAVRAQLATWQRAVEQCIAIEMSSDPTPVPLLLPRIVRHETGGPAELRFTAPEHIGADVLAESRSTDDVLQLLRKVAAALDALHARHFIHGGLGLPSLWWMRDGTLRLPDAGLAHVLDRLMAVPQEAGAYVAPEVWRGGGVVPASDQYALAVIAFELFTGRKRAVKDEEGMMSVAPLSLESGVRLYPGARAEMSDVLQRALSAMPESRFGTCAEFIEALAGQAVGVHSLPTLHRETWRDGTMWSARVAALALVALGTVAGTGYALRESFTRQVTRPVAGITMPEIADAAVRTVRAIPKPSAGGGSGGNGGGSRSGGGGSRRATSGSGATSPGGGNGASPVVDAVASAASAIGSRIGGDDDRRRPASAPAAKPAPARRTPTATASRAPAAARGRSEPLVQGTAAARSASTLGPQQQPVVASRSVLPAPRPAPVTTGILRLRGPSGARYYVDGVLIRPVKGVATVPQGEHEVDIVVPNRNSTRHRVTVHPGETVTVKR